MGQKIDPYSSTSSTLQCSLSISQCQRSGISAQLRLLIFTSGQLLIRNWLKWLEQMSVWWWAHCTPYLGCPLSSNKGGAGSNRTELWIYGEDAENVTSWEHCKSLSQWPYKYHRIPSEALPASINLHSKPKHPYFKPIWAFSSLNI